VKNHEKDLSRLGFVHFVHFVWFVADGLVRGDA